LAHSGAVVGLVTEHLSRSEAYSVLAWELAHHCTFTVGDLRPVRAELPSFTLLEPVQGEGNTTTEAMQDLARNLDRLAEAVR
jgi:hypothetical protein